LSEIYLIRHGRAGTREDYDQLSDLGRAQSNLLGEYLAAQGVGFQSVYAGGLARQQETMRAVADAYRRAGLSFPEPSVHEGWNEFDLDRVYRAIAPRLCEDDAEFRAEYERMSAEIRATRGRAEADVHRRWSACDIQVVDAWIRGRYDYDGESWRQFLERVSGCRSTLNGQGAGDIAIFTSATPTAIWAGLAMDIADERIMRLAAVLYNTSITTLRRRGDQLRLFSFNGVPHLPSAAMRTHR
jgi:broad specificity phosphatase PhoE